MPCITWGFRPRVANATGGECESVMNRSVGVIGKMALQT
jgi:hypothetical protein